MQKLFEGMKIDINIMDKIKEDRCMQTRELLQVAQEETIIIFAM